MTRYFAMATAAALSLAACAPQAQDVIADGPIGPRLYSCEDGTELQVWVQMGGSIVWKTVKATTCPKSTSPARRLCAPAGRQGLDFPVSRPGEWIRLVPGEDVATARGTTCTEHARRPDTCGFLDLSQGGIRGGRPRWGNHLARPP